MKKEIEVWLKISQAWKRTVVFMKLVRHKTLNGTLHWEYDEYSFAIIGHYRDLEIKLMHDARNDERWGDRKSKQYLDNPYRNKKRAFEKYEFDEEIRDIIKKIDEKAQKENVS